MRFSKLVHFKKIVINLVCILLFATFIDRAELVHQDADDAAETDDNGEDAAGAAHIIYDQRQTGKYNIHVVIKDVAIIEMDQNEIQDPSYGDEDYYYDDNDFTVKPISLLGGTTTTTTTTTALENTTRTTGATTTVVNTKATGTTKTLSNTKPSSGAMHTTTADSLETDTNTAITGNNQDETTFIFTQEQTTKTSDLYNTLLPTKLPYKPTTKTPSVVILSTPASPIALAKTSADQSPFHAAVNIKARSKVEPIFALEEPIQVSQQQQHSLKSKYIPAESFHLNTDNARSLGNSKIFKVKLRRAHNHLTQQQQQQQPNQLKSPFKTRNRRCRSNQYRDLNGNCRSKRSSPSSGSILKRLFKMLITMPFVRGEQQNED